MYLKRHFMLEGLFRRRALSFLALLLAAVVPPFQPGQLLAQEVETIVGEEVDEVEAEFILERLERLQGKPLDLNTATAGELAELPWISPLLARKILALRERIGAFRSLHDLIVIEGMSYELLQAMSPYLTITYKGVPYWAGTEGRVRAVGENSARWPDGADFYARFTSRPSEQVEVCYIMDKDDGEKDFTDFQAGYVVVKGEGALSRVSVGDLSAQFGQGLVLWTPQGYFRGYETVSQAERGASGVRGYRSSIENGALRGAHVQVSGNGLEADVLFSRSRLDAYLNDDGSVRRLADTGYHRTEWELRSKDVLREDMFAAHAVAQPRPALVLEGTYCSARYDPGFASDDEPAYYFSGEKLSAGSVGMRLLLPRADLFGEAAMMSGGGKAQIVGWVSDLRHLEMASVFRNYDRDYYNLRASSFSGDEPWNERGVYVGLRTRARGSKVSFYVDGVQHPGPRHGESFPTSGYEVASSLERNYGNGMTARLRGKLARRKMSVVNPDDPYSRMSITSSRETVSGDVSWNPRGPLSMRLRYSSVRVSGNEKGSLWSAGFGYARERVVNLKGRVIYYDTSSYESRVYEWEDNLPGRVDFGPLWGEGMKWYLLLGVRSARYTVSAKFGQERPVDDEPASEFGLQLDFTL